MKGKKLLSVFLALTMVGSLAACGSGSSKSGGATSADSGAVAEAIKKAETMSEQELADAAKKELEAHKDLKFNADSLTSGVKKAMAKFEKKYPFTAGRMTYNSKKGSEYQPKLIAAQKADSYIADFVMIQDGSFLKNAMLDTGFLLSYTPKGEEFNIDEKYRNPQVGVTFNKVFMYDNTKIGKKQIENVWQMTGVDGTSLKGLHDVSYESPLGEDVNMNFLIMLTSPESCERLAKAYKDYFGKEYNPSEDKEKYKNIGYKFVAEFIKNVGYWHSSDTSEVKQINMYADEGRIIFAGLNKLKDYEYFKPKYENTDQYYKKTITASGWNLQIDGFDGYIYNMWTLIPRTAKLPYTSCLFIRYILSEEGFNAGWGGILGYYSANENNKTVEGDPPLATWKKQCVVEDANYIDSVYNEAVKFINMQLAGK